MHAESSTLSVAAVSPVVRPGEQVAITYSLAGSSAISTLQWDEDVDERLSVSGRVLGPSLAGAAKQLQCENHRCVAAGFGQDVIGEGPLFTAVVTVEADAAPGRAMLRLHRVLAARPDAAPAELQSGRDFVFTIVEPGAPEVVREAIVNAATYQAGMTPGGLVTIFGAALSDAAGIRDAGLAKTFEGVSVLVNGVAAPLLSLVNVNGSEQINLQTPFETPAGLATVEVNHNGARTLIGGVNVFEAQAGIFELGGADGGSVPAVTHSDGSLVDAGRPASPGEIVSVYFTGGGGLDPFVGTAELGPEPPALIPLGVTVTVGDFTYSVDFAGYVPGSVGLYQVNFQVPEALPSGPSVAVRLNVGASVSNTVSVFVQ